MERKRLTEQQLRTIIKKELSKVLNEWSRADQFVQQNMEDIDKIAEMVKNRFGNQPCWNYNNRMYAVFKPAQGMQRAQYWLRKPTVRDAERNIESDLSSLLYDLKLISDPAPSKEELRKMKFEQLPVRDQFGNIGSAN